MSDTKTENSEKIIFATKEMNKSEELSPQPATLRQMYRYVSGKYIILGIIGIINAFIAGATNPARLVIIRDTFNEVETNNARDAIADGMREKNLWFGILSGIGGITCYIFCFSFMIIGSKISYELKWRYLRAVLSQDCNWYDRQNIEELPTKINVNITEVENATGKTSGFIIYSIGAFVAGIGGAFFIGAVLACCYLIIPPFVMMCGGSRALLIMKSNQQIERAYEKSGADAEQALSSIRVVKAFGQETSEYHKFENHLSQADKSVHRFSFLYGLSCGLVETLFYFVPAYSLMIGGFFIAGGITNKNVDRKYIMGDILGAYLSILAGTLFFGLSAMNILTLKRGLVCAGEILSVIDREPPIDINKRNAIDTTGIFEDIKFENVSFSYQGRNKAALKNITLTFKYGETTALVGSSGCGKSTIVKLIERFYDPDEGRVIVNGKDLKTLNLQQYRRKVGYVGQEPCLLNESILDNLLNANPYATTSDIINALKAARAYDFVAKLPNGLNYEVGGVGTKLSGGQKQRIAIARELLKNPDVLILDEATSALDKENEKEVQKAIDNIGKNHNITTIVIAHRLSTIKNSNIIYVLKEGEIAEIGNHSSLLKEGGIYASFYKSQELAHNIYAKHQENNSEAEILEIIKECTERESIAENEDNPEILEKMGPFQIFKKLLPYNEPKLFIFTLFIGCTIVASGMPTITAFVVTCLFEYTSPDSGHVRKEMAKYCSIIACAGVLIAVIQLINKYTLQMLSLSMTKLIRKDIYRCLLNQPGEFYDRKENSTGQLTSIIAADSRFANGASIELYILLFQGMTGMAAGVVIGFIMKWNLGLVILGLLPATGFCTYFQFVVQTTPPPKATKYSKFEKTIISDSVANYTTVLSLANQDAFVDRYYNCAENENQSNNPTFDPWQTHWFSLIYAASNALINGYVIPMIYVMASNIENGSNICDQYIALIAGIIGSMTLSVAMFNSPDFEKGQESASKIFGVIDRPHEGKQNCSISEGSREITLKEAQGEIEFRDVWFRYPSSQNWILKNFNLKINKQESIGLIGESGCGKSTTTLLLLRFYDPNHGSITIGGINITEFTIKSLRSVFGLVQQEPIIFNCSIMDNICYGKPNATAQEIKKAAELANASNFIEKLIEDKNNQELNIAAKESDSRYLELNTGYQVICGHRGNKLSGGEKQRIAIARALIRNPSILLLDEATSALDETTQAEVQQTLDDISKSKTSIVIAHRNSTLSKCNRIVEICDGVILNKQMFEKSIDRNL